MSFRLEKRVATAIVKLIEAGVKPSQTSVIKLIGGSYSSVGKVFKNLEQEFNGLSESSNIEALAKNFGIGHYSGKRLLNELKAVQEKLALLEKHNLQLEAKNIELGERLFEMEHSKNHFESLYKCLENDREQILSAIKAEKDQQINTLIEELAAMHKVHTESFREFSYNHSDKVLQKDIEILNLKTKVEELRVKLDERSEKTLPQIKRIKVLVNENANLMSKVSELETQLSTLKQEKHEVAHAN